jgi:UDP-N-acetylglucosamine 2-epimerase (non-hydrolysing)
MILVDPIGYEELLVLMTHSKGVLTDSGTIPEEFSVLNIPCVQIRKATERPQVYDVGGCVKFDPDRPDKYPQAIVWKKLKKITGTKWQHTLGDGKSSERIAADIVRRARENDFHGHLFEHNHLPIQRSLIDDGIKL